jgi:hypothetical protein
MIFNENYFIMIKLFIILNYYYLNYNFKMIIYII